MHVKVFLSKEDVYFFNLDRYSHKAVSVLFPPKVKDSAHLPTYFENGEREFRPRWRRRQKPFASSHNQKEDNNQSKINKQPEMPENETACNSNNQGIKKQSTIPTRLVR